ncbi:hypothetical protein EVA_16792, partial [gut metagenome]
MPVFNRGSRKSKGLNNEMYSKEDLQNL